MARAFDEWSAPLNDSRGICRKRGDRERKWTGKEHKFARIGTPVGGKYGQVRNLPHEAYAQTRAMVRKGAHRGRFFLKFVQGAHAGECAPWQLAAAHLG